ncbi:MULTISPECIES: class I SAM-dependent methyltransferase [unclassified Enterococcus]|jgi:SAM-dependent methyltransferase|uniref:class I SAM-dependent methyltransferase n=1 Tax=unclassified Enterococcus TaxID=2608891 RepID=UPI003D26CA72
MNMDYIIDFHIEADRQSPGSNQETLNALKSVPNWREKKSILDVGSGTGAQTLVLAENTAAKVTAVDLLQPFLDKLLSRAADAGVGERVSVRNLSMDALDFPPESFDLIWSEGSIYTIGFEKGLKYWKHFLSEEGHLVVSDLCWLTEARPKEIEHYWKENYPDITTINQRLETSELGGYKVLDHFIMSESSWKENYYDEIRKRSLLFAQKYPDNLEVQEMLKMGIAEADTYDTYGSYYSYVFFILEPIH